MEDDIILLDDDPVTPPPAAPSLPEPPPVSSDDPTPSASVKSPPPPPPAPASPVLPRVPSPAASMSSVPASPTPSAPTETKVTTVADSPPPPPNPPPAPRKVPPPGYTEMNGPDLLKLFVDSYTSEQPLYTVDLENENSRGDTTKSCSNSDCSCVTETKLVSPTYYARKYYQLPKGASIKICSECENRHKAFVVDLANRLGAGDSIFKADYPITNPIVIIDDSDEDADSDEEMTDVSSSDSREKRRMRDLVRTICEKFQLKYHIRDSVLQIKKNLKQEKDKLMDLKQDFANLEQEESELMEQLHEAFAPENKSKPELVISPFSTVIADEDCVFAGGIGPEEPAHLPPVGPIEYPKPAVDQVFYVIGRSTDWLPCVVIEATTKMNELGIKKDYFQVRLEYGKKTYTKEVEASMLADYVAPTMRVGLGTRIIAVYENPNDAKIIKTENQGPRADHKWYAGFIAEPPSGLNGYRYLIFFENGIVQYVEHYDIRLVCEHKKPIHEFFSPDMSEFIKSYFESYPERSMVKFQHMDFVRVFHRGLWLITRVLQLDASLVQVVFMTDSRIEWLYRGSPKLLPIFEARNMHKNRARRLKSTFSRFTSGGRPVFVQMENANAANDIRQMYEERSKAVARKSTTRLPDYAPDSPPQRRMLDRRVTRMDHGRIDKRMPPNMLTPRTFRTHKCSRACVSWVGYDERKLRGVNPLAIPSIFGFKRDSEFSHTFYIGPCGRRLKDMMDVFRYLRETGLPLTLDLFDFNYFTRIFDELIVSREHVLIEDFSRGSEFSPIPCINTIDSDIPDLMSYMTERRGHNGVHLNLDPDFLVCCDCTDNCCEKSKCACWQLTISTHLAFSKESAYNIDSVGYQFQRLPGHLMSGIYECNQRCKCCKKTCLNRVVQHPSKVKLQLFKTKKKGWGTRCVNDIPSGSFVCNYVGNIYTESEANEIGKIHGDEYFAELDHIEVMEDHKENYEEDVPEFANMGNVAAVNRYNENSSSRSLRSRTAPINSDSESESEESDDIDMRLPTNDDSLPKHPSVREYYGKDEAVYVMDTKLAGNIGRFLNHSCNPNIFVQNVYVDTHDLRFPWVSFFALKYIPAGTELTWNYGYNIGSVPGKKLYCYCEEENCRRRLL